MEVGSTIGRLDIDLVSENRDRGMAAPHIHDVGDTALQDETEQALLMEGQVDGVRLTLWMRLLWAAHNHRAQKRTWPSSFMAGAVSALALS